MEVSNEQLREYTRRIMLSRMRLLCNNGFYGLLLMHMKISISDEHDGAWSDMCDKLYFNPEFLDKVSDREMDYILMHLIMHVVLNHLSRRGDILDDAYDQAADIVVNSNILRSSGGALESIYLESYGGMQPHKTPNGDYGWKYSVEEIYWMLRLGSPSDEDSEENNEEDSLNGNGQEDDNPNDDQDGENQDGGEEGTQNKSSSDNASNNSQNSSPKRKGWDYHNYNLPIYEVDISYQKDIWQQRVIQAATAIQLRDTDKSVGQIPAFAQRYIESLKKPQTDWRTILHEFVQEEINDYSFCPPDKRFGDSPFFLPDFNEKDYRVEKVLFMIDTSGSMSDEEVAQCYSEIKGAIDQFDGKLEGWLGFFDAVVFEPKPFVDESEFKAIRPIGGGGTRFDIIFKYIDEHMAEEPPVSIVILTDGYAPFPKENSAHGIPVLWIIDNEKVTPPWGKIARIVV